MRFDRRNIDGRPRNGAACGRDFSEHAEFTERGPTALDRPGHAASRSTTTSFHEPIRPGTKTIVVARPAPVASVPRRREATQNTAVGPASSSARIPASASTGRLSCRAGDFTFLIRAQANPQGRFGEGQHLIESNVFERARALARIGGDAHTYCRSSRPAAERRYRTTSSSIAPRRRVASDSSPKNVRLRRSEAAAPRFGHTCPPGRPLRTRCRLPGSSTYVTIQSSSVGQPERDRSSRAPRSPPGRPDTRTRHAKS